MVATDHSKAIIASLFNPASASAQATETYIAHVQTSEDLSSNQRKTRFLILSSAKDGKLKLHKAKQNTNGSFSIGKTWALEELRTVEVSKPLEFSLVISAKTYKYDTESPSSNQAAFLVTMVRCWRRYQASTGREIPELVLLGFSVDSTRAATPTSRPSTMMSVNAPSIVASTSASSTGTFLSARPTTPSGASTRGARPQSSTSSGGRSISNSSFGAAANTSVSTQRPTTPTAAQPGLGARRPSAAPSSKSYDEPSAGMAHKRSNPSISTTARGPAPTTRIVSPVSANQEGSFSNFHWPSASTSTSQPDLSTRQSHAGRPLSSSVPDLNALSKPTTEPRVLPARIEDAVLDDEAVLSNVEEMLEGFEWRAGTSMGYGGYGGVQAKGRGDEIEKRLMGELKALDAASIHAIMESDDRVTAVIKHLDDALLDLDKMDSMIGMYRTQLNLMTEDIAHIEGQNRGLQVQTSNQRALLSELDTLMETIHIPDGDLTALTQESLENPKGIERLERAAVSLYKALLSTRDTPVGDMAAASERVEEYRTKASQFSKRLCDFLSIMFKFQVDQLVNPKESVVKTRTGTTLPSHAPMEDFLGRYCGLMLFVKEIDYGRYQQICAAYFTAMSELHRSEINSLIGAFRGQIKKPSDEELDSNFASMAGSPNIRQQSIRRAGTLVRSPLEMGRREKDTGAKLNGSEAFARSLVQITPHVTREQGFISDFLHINALDASITFADYMMLETYFRRGATSYLATQQGKLKDVRSAMDLVFGFLDNELKEWIEFVLGKDSMQIVGVLAALDRSILNAEEDRNESLLRTLQKHYQRSIIALESACKDQMKSIEQTKLTLKKRKGVVPFVRIFPMFVTRIESQLVGASDLKTRDVIDSNYERIVATMFDSLQQMAKMDGEASAGEAKGMLNYHIIIIENMHHIVTVFSSQKIAALSSFVKQAQDMYTNNLEAYIKLALRRPFARLLDQFILLAAPTLPVLSTYKRLLTDFRSKDTRKAIEVLYKRVEKHFGPEGGGEMEVVRAVWRAMGEEMGQLVEAAGRDGRRWFPDEKSLLEFGPAEIKEWFAKAGQ